MGRKKTNAPAAAPLQQRQAKASVLVTDEPLLPPTGGNPEMMEMMMKVMQSMPGNLQNQPGLPPPAHPAPPLSGRSSSNSDGSTKKTPNTLFSAAAKANSQSTRGSRGLNLNRFKYFDYYDNATFPTEEELIGYQQERHFTCLKCGAKHMSLPALTLHHEQMHGEPLGEVPNSIPGRKDPGVVVLGLKGIPAEVLLERSIGTDYEPIARQRMMEDAEKITSGFLNFNEPAIAGNPMSGVRKENLEKLQSSQILNVKGSGPPGVPNLKGMMQNTMGAGPLGPGMMMGPGKPFQGPNPMQMMAQMMKGMGGMMGGPMPVMGPGGPGMPGGMGSMLAAMGKGVTPQQGLPNLPMNNSMGTVLNGPNSISVHPGNPMTGMMNLKGAPPLMNSNPPQHLASSNFSEDLDSPSHRRNRRSSDSREDSRNRRSRDRSRSNDKRRRREDRRSHEPRRDNLDGPGQIQNHVPVLGPQSMSKGPPNFLGASNMMSGSMPGQNNMMGGPVGPIARPQQMGLAPLGKGVFNPNLIPINAPTPGMKGMIPPSQMGNGLNSEVRTPTSSTASQAVYASAPSVAGEAVPEYQKAQALANIDKELLVFDLEYVSPEEIKAFKNFGVPIKYFDDCHDRK